MSRKKTKKSPVDRKYVSKNVEQLLNASPTSSFTRTKIAKKLGLKSTPKKKVLDQTLQYLLDRSMIKRLPDGSYQSVEKSSYIEGTVDYVNPRLAFVVSPQSETDIKIRPEDLNTALDDDFVKVQVSSSRRGKHPTGRVVEILKRNRTEFVGRFEKGDNHGFVIPDFRKMHHDIFVRVENFKNAEDGDKVIVRVTRWHHEQKNPSGKIIRVLGKAGEHHAEMHSIMAEFNLPFEFPKQVLAAADAISEVITEDEIKKRRDFRDITTLTIDPVDAKDFDDALSIRKVKGLWEIGIHIADVAHYVQKDSVLDREAFKRATSVYLVDRTIPMLPEKLSNQLCSLRPLEDKLAFSVVVTMNDHAEIMDKWVGRTVINSNHRFAYEGAQEVIEGRSELFADEITKLNELALLLNKKRFSGGSMNFETPEVRFRLDENGKPVEVVNKIRKEAHKMIEEFMLLANKIVAKKVSDMQKPFVYRIHDRPNFDKLIDFQSFAKRFGHEINLGEKSVASSINKLMVNVQGKPEQDVLMKLAIQSMAKAVYSQHNIGHFGLAFDHYTHFTSPIRRYPDVMVHRLIERYDNKGRSVNEDKLEEQCDHSSMMERNAAKAERASIKYKQVEFMSLQEQQVFEGIISGVTEWGIYVEISATHCEGMVRLADLQDDHYVYDEKNYAVYGSKNGKKYTLGEKLKVMVLRTDIDRRTIDLELVTD